MRIDKIEETYWTKVQDDNLDLYGVDGAASVNLGRLNFSSLGGSKIRKFNLSNSTTRLLQTQLLLDHFS